MALFTTALLSTLFGSVTKLIDKGLQRKLDQDKMADEEKMFSIESAERREERLHESKILDQTQSFQSEMQDKEDYQEREISADNMMTAAIVSESKLQAPKDSWTQKLRVALRPVLTIYFVAIISYLALQFLKTDGNSMTAAEFTVLVNTFIELGVLCTGFWFGARITR